MGANASTYSQRYSCTYIHTHVSYTTYITYTCVHIWMDRVCRSPFLIASIVSEVGSKILS